MVGELKIDRHVFSDGRAGVMATLRDPRGYSVSVQVLKPLFDPQIMATQGAGFLLCGWEIDSSEAGHMVHEYRQIWHCVPVTRAK